MPLRTPETFPTALMMGEDFDLTVANTFKKSPAGIGVEEASTLAVEGVFNAAGVERYLKDGGLRNRAPRQVVAELCGFGADAAEVNAKTEEYSHRKLEVLTSEIGTRYPDGSIYPKPISGYELFKEALEKANEQGANVDEIVISSGHVDFIAKTFVAWSMTPPLHIVASEVTASHPDYAPDELVKPKPGLMRVGHGLWRGSYGVKQKPILDEELDRIIYIGDDREKDGGLARNSGVHFVHIDNYDELSAANSWLLAGLRMKLMQIQNPSGSRK